MKGVNLLELTSAALWLNTAFAGFDEGVTAAVHSLYVAAGPILTPLMNFVSLLGKGGIFLILLSLALLLVRKTRRFGTAMLIGIIPCMAAHRRQNGRMVVEGDCYLALHR